MVTYIVKFRFPGLWYSEYPLVINRIIDICCTEYCVENYSPMINAINNLNSYYKQQLAARATRCKAKQDVGMEEPMEPVEK